MATQALTKKIRRNYGVQERATMLAAWEANHRNTQATAHQFGIRDTSLIRIIQDAQRDTERARQVRELRDAKCGDLASAFEDMAWEAVAQARNKLPEASARDAAVCAGIAAQKKMELRGELGQGTTVNVNVSLANVPDAVLHAALRQLAGGPVVEALPSPTGPIAIGQVVDGDVERGGDAGRGVKAGPVDAPAQLVDGLLRQPGGASQTPLAHAAVGQEPAETVSE